MTARLLQGDCLDVMRQLAADGVVVQAIVTDPPYGLSVPPDIAEVMRHWLAGDEYQHRGAGFMGKAWDSFVPGPAYWRAAYDLLPPGGHVLCFAGTRTADLMSIALRFAGFEIRETLMWVFGSGFPKSHNVANDIDKRAGLPPRGRAIPMASSEQASNGRPAAKREPTPAAPTTPTKPKPRQDAAAQMDLLA